MNVPLWAAIGSSITCFIIGLSSAPVRRCMLKWQILRDLDSERELMNSKITATISDALNLADMSTRDFDKAQEIIDGCYHEMRGFNRAILVVKELRLH